MDLKEKKQKLAEIKEEFEYKIRKKKKIKDRNHFVNEPFEKVRHLIGKQTV